MWNKKKNKKKKRRKKAHARTQGIIITGGTTKFAYIIDVPQRTHIICASARLEFNEVIYR